MKPKFSKGDIVEVISVNNASQFNSDCDIMGVFKNNEWEKRLYVIGDAKKTGFAHVENTFAYSLFYDGQLQGHVYESSLRLIKSNKMRTITWQEAQELIDMVDGYCGWKNMLLDLYARDIVLKKNIEVTSALLQQGRKEASQSQKEVIDRIFGKEKEEIDLRKETGIENIKLFDKFGGTPTSLIAMRGDGCYEDKAFYLNPNFNWEIKKDNQNELCLIPTHK